MSFIQVKSETSTFTGVGAQLIKVGRVDKKISFQFIPKTSKDD